MPKQDVPWQRCLISQNSSIRDAVKTIDESGLQIALVVREDSTLLGTVTDGDIRRALLRELPLESPVDTIMYSTPLVVTEHITREQVEHLMKVNKVHKVPIVSSTQQVIGLHVWEQVADSSNEGLDIPFVIMAGGLGSRLMPFTEKCPKPMLKVAGKPMLEHIIIKARDEGFSNFIISVNYLGDVIKRYFGKGKRFGVNIEYLEENQPLGTAGALAQLQQKPFSCFLVTNGDVISDLRYSDFIRYHLKHDATATMAVRTHEWQNPFGVVQLDGLNITGFEEKPKIKSQINAGVYALSSEAISILEAGKTCDMPALFDRIIELRKKAIVFPLHETWADIGKPEDLERANNQH